MDLWIPCIVHLQEQVLFMYSTILTGMEDESMDSVCCTSTGAGIYLYTVQHSNNRHGGWISCTVQSTSLKAGIYMYSTIITGNEGWIRVHVTH